MSLKLLAKAVQSLLQEALKKADSSLNDLTQIVIGSPHETAKQQEDNAASGDENYLSVFFYRIGYSAFSTDTTSKDPLYLNAFCLISALCGRSGDIMSGDTELKLIGVVLDYFHRHPILKLDSDGDVVKNGKVVKNGNVVDGVAVAHLQVVPTPFSLEDINHLWATQSQTPYRLSLGYEFALLPLPLASRPGPGPRVSSVSLEARSTEKLSKELLDEIEEVTGTRPEHVKRESSFTPQVPFVQIDTERPDWSPHICFLDETGAPTYTLTEFPVSTTSVSLIVLGDPETEVNLVWEVLEAEEASEVLDHATRSWKTGLDGGSSQPKASSLPEDTGSLSALAVSIDLPKLGHKGQALLRATRSLNREGGSPLTLTSNPVLITVELGP
ncbi:MAG: DUF4255 domain-containing protein [Betaproteobacteria bacterium]|nr:DUF4255 domain-containing protein [Betaproteobacteria bacterium]